MRYQPTDDNRDHNSDDDNVIHLPISGRGIPASRASRRWRRARQAFPDDLELATKPRSTDFTVTEELVYRGQVDGITTRVVVAAGTTTDLASIPRPLTPLIPRHGIYTEAAVVHDFLYRGQCHGSSRAARRLADRVMRQAMIDLGCARWRRTLVYVGLRLFGHLSWSKNRRACADRRDLDRRDSVLDHPHLVIGSPDPSSTGGRQDGAA
ncbi:MAG: DUF1353 domain-containing protein [Acidimicrobiales bacterium]